MKNTLLYVTVALVVAVCTGCEFAPPDSGPTSRPSLDEHAVLGTPDEDWPGTISELLAVTEPEALTWQDEPVLVDVTVWFDGDSSSAWRQVRVSYIAGDAERFFTYQATPDGSRINRPVLSGQLLTPVPRSAVTQIPPLQGVLEPVQLAANAATALAACGGGNDVVSVTYNTGAPGNWDGQEWDTPPNWRALVFSEGAGVVVDPATGTADSPPQCLAVTDSVNKNRE